jgi:hypothetical protein
MNVDLEVKVTANCDCVAGLTHRADALASVDAFAAVDEGRAGHMGVEVGAVLAFAVEQEVVAVEDRVVAGAENFAVTDGYERGATGGDDVEALVRATAAAWRTELPDVAAGAVWAIDREYVPVELSAAILRPYSNGEKKYKQGDRGRGEASCTFCAAG